MPFLRLWAASGLSALGDGITQIAGALLVASLTRDPMRVAGIAIAQMLPWMLFALPSGVLVDHLDPRRLMAAVSLIRAAALAVLGATLALGAPSLPLLYAVFFVVGCAGLVHENAATTLVPAVVDPAELPRANGRLQATTAVAQWLAAKPVGGLLFGMAAWMPFVLDPLALMVVAALALTLPGGGVAPPALDWRAAIGEGLRWLARHRLLRTLSIAVLLSNLGLSAVTATFVLVARQRLGLGPVGFGVLLAAGAAGGIAGGLCAHRLIARLGLVRTFQYGLLVELLVHLGLALTRDRYVAGALFVVLSMHLAISSATGASIRQTLVPAEMLGRVHSAYRLGTNTGMLLGSVLGGLLARSAGLTAPFWLGVVCVLLLTVYAWPILASTRVRGMPPSPSAWRPENAERA